MITTWGNQGNQGQSIGAALCPEGDGMDYETLFKAADEAMYLDKEQSKNWNESREAGEENRTGQYNDTAGGTSMKHGWGSIILLRWTGTLWAVLTKEDWTIRESLLGHTQKQPGPGHPMHSSGPVMQAAVAGKATGSD